MKLGHIKLEPTAAYVRNIVQKIKNEISLIREVPSPIQEVPWEHDEEDFNIMRRLEIGDWVLLWVYYPQCPNPNKIMVFSRENAPVLGAKKIFPHFDRQNSPMARFVATEEGWRLAIKFVEKL